MKKNLRFFCCVMGILLAGGSAAAQSGTFTQTGTVQGPAESIASIVVSPDGRTIAYGTYADSLIRIVDVAAMQEIRFLSGHVQPVTGLAFSPNSQLLASTGTIFLGDPVDGTVRLWDVASGAQLASVETASMSGTSQLAFSPDGSMLAGAGGGGTTLKLILWDATTLNVIREMTGVFRMVSFSPDGSRIATGKRDDKVYIMNVSTGTGITSFSGHTGWIQSVAYSSGGQTLATGGEDRSILVRSSQNGQTALTLTGHTSFPNYLKFSPDESMIASLGSGINITRTGGLSISMSDVDRFLRIWDTGTGAEMSRLNTESDVICGVSFSDDWKILVTGSESGLIRIFEWSPSSSVPEGAVLASMKSIRNYPNPFPTVTTIEYQLQESCKVDLKIYDDTGKQVSPLVNEFQSQGSQKVVWNAEGLPPGLYFARLIAGQQIIVHKLLKM
ncbi:MAG: T9SS type A sorting domain-containing protein [Bacteroidota bacterium]